MWLHRIFVIASLLTFALIVLGGVVHSTGSSLACPDWPLCYGQVFPEMVGGVAIEHSHRLLASLIGLLMVIATIQVWRNRRINIRTRQLTTVALVLVIAQGTLGGITVIYQLPTAISTAHLATAMAFFALLVTLSLRTHRDLRPFPRSLAASKLKQLWSFVAAFTYFQIVLGALVRHTGSGYACGGDWVLCQGMLWPHWGPAALHMLHRYGAVLVLSVTVVAVVTTLRDSRAALVHRLAWVQLALILTQIALGITNLATMLHVAAVTAHLAVGALLWLVSFFVAMRLRMNQPTSKEAYASSQVPADPPLTQGVAL